MELTAWGGNGNGNENGNDSEVMNLLQMRSPEGRTW
jgi:hypothetical protein